MALSQEEKSQQRRTRDPEVCESLESLTSTDYAAMILGFATVLAASANDRRDLCAGAVNRLGTVQQNIEHREVRH